MHTHAWDVSVTDATAIQKKLHADIRLVPLQREADLIAGGDISFTRGSDMLYAGFIVLALPDLREVAHAVTKMRVGFPYVPGYLSFREVPPLLDAFARLSMTPDVIMMDGQGIAHPRRLGVAAHLGLALEMPSFGCAKNRLFGTAQEPAEREWSMAPLSDPKTRETIGAVVRTKRACKPIFISPGHLITLEDSLALTRRVTRGYRLPEPTRRAHELVNAYRRRDIGAY